MTTLFYQIIYKVSSLALLPYLAIMLVTMPFLIHRKLLILRQLRNVPATTIFATDLSKVKKNLQIKSMIQNFILIIYCFEAIVCLSNSISNIYGAFGPSQFIS